MNLSKSRYTQGVTCSKKLWLSCYMPEEAEDMGKANVFDTGNKVGELARVKKMFLILVIKLVN